MRTYKVILVEHSMKTERGNRILLSEKILASCPSQGNAMLICDYMKTVYTPELFPRTGDNNRIYGLTVTSRSVSDLINPY